MARSNKDTFDNTLKGSQDVPLLPPRRNDAPQAPPRASTLKKFREQEDPTREDRLRALWKSLPATSPEIGGQNVKGNAPILISQEATERAEKMRQLYNQELMGRQGDGKAKPVDFKQFVKVCYHNNFYII